jgi:hypothetical protein
MMGDGLVKIIGDTLGQMPWKRIVPIGIDGLYEDMRKRKNEERSVERETHGLEERD